MTDDIETTLTQIVYVSAAAVEFSEDDLDNLLEAARTNNAALDVTGVLLYSEGTFFQVLEGVPEIVTELYEKIAMDTRHNNVLMLSQSDIEDRNFGDWSMGFIRQHSMIKKLPGFVDFFSTGKTTFIDLLGDSKRINQILEGFRSGRWRRSAAPS